MRFVIWARVTILDFSPVNNVWSGGFGGDRNFEWKVWHVSGTML